MFIGIDEIAWEFDGELGLLQAVQAIPGIDILVPGSAVEVRCSIKDHDEQGGIVPERDDGVIFMKKNQVYSSTFRFVVTEGGIVADGLAA